ncbi:MULTISPECIES: hypothetical protein [Pseudomonas]|uniref:hypothetical protein n=1 Tax=Pseudomonas TaxID=286 RepID=UPI0006D418E6|nr:MULTISPECIES: hypothetical protein [Pseudomonas]OBY89687.1 hypothetical protein A6723_005455 [Pseudomonas sp. AU11447]
MLKFIRTTIAGGLLFILPLVLVFVLVEKAIHLLTPPVQKLLPLFTGFTALGVTEITLACIVLLALLCFLAGLLARTRAASAALQTLEDRLLSNLPGYPLLKDAAARFTGMDDVGAAKVGLVSEDVGFRFALIFEERDDWLLVYLPDGGPAGGTAGEVRMVPASSVRITDIPWLPLLGCLRRGGLGALELAARHMGEDGSPQP